MPRSASSLAEMCRSFSIPVILPFPFFPAPSWAPVGCGVGRHVDRAAARLRPADFDHADPRLRHRPFEVDVKQTVVEPGALHLDPLREHEGTLALPCR